MSKKRTTTSQQTLDPRTQAYVDQMRKYATNAANQPFEAYGGPFLDQYTTGAAGDYRNQIDAGNLGLGALTGNPDSVSKMMNPYLKTLDPFFDQLRAKSLNAVDSRATAAGAYGGDRNYLAQGTALNDINNTQAQTNYQAFNDTMARAQGLAALGQNATGSLGDIGRQRFLAQYADFLRKQGYPSQQLGLLQQGMGPYGTTSTTTQKGGDIFSSVLGLLGIYTGAGGKLPNLGGGPGPSGGAAGPSAYPV